MKLKIDPTDAQKIKEKLTLDKLTRKKIWLDESRIWNIKMNWKKTDSARDLSRLSFLIGYLFEEEKLKRLLKITGSSHDFTSLIPEEKTKLLYDLTIENHASTPNSGNSDEFYSEVTKSFAVLIHALSHTVLRFADRIQRLFVPKFYGDRKDTNFLKGLTYFGEKKETDEKYFLRDLYLVENCMNTE